MRCIIPRKINSFYIRLLHFPITIIIAFFDAGVFGPIIFGITFVIPDFKLRFYANLLGNVIVEALRPKTSCICFMVIILIIIFENLIAVESRYIVASQKMVINTLVVKFYTKF